MTARVVALGQRAAGDDGVGLAVLDRLREHAPPGVELVELADASALIPLIETSAPLVVVDAVVMDGRSAGDVVELEAEALPPGARPVSSHGIDLCQAIAIGRSLAGRDANTPRIRLVAIAIELPICGSFGLSRRVEAAIPRAVHAVWSALA